MKDAAGRVHQEGKIAATRRDLDGWVRTLPQPRTMAMEATMFTGWIRVPRRKGEWTSEARLGDSGTSGHTTREVRAYNLFVVSVVATPHILYCMAIAMKQILYRGGVVTFRIPSQWREDYSDVEGGTFYEDRPDSGTLRLRIITMKTTKELHSVSATDILGIVVGGLKKNNVESWIRQRKDGIAVLKYEETAHEQGMQATIFHWVIANSLPPHRARIITFSYTILAEQRGQKSLQRNLAMLEAEIESATLSPELGIVPGDPTRSETCGRG